MFVDWQPRYSVGVNEMDDAHKRLMKLMNQLHEERAAGEPKAALRRTLKELGDFTRKHFSEEEAYMGSIAFPALDTHKRIHAQLLRDFEGHAAAFEAGKGEIPDAFFNFLRLWLTAHIMGIDAKYGEHARAAR